MHRARLIPVSGIGSEIEAEQRATSALLAVLSTVRDLSEDLLSPLGASKAQKAAVDAYTEVIYPHNGKKIRPDGLIEVTFGKARWSTFVEVKTGSNTLASEQVNDYWELARAAGVDHVLTISNEIPTAAGVHPTVGLKVRANSKVAVSHLSWSAILAAAIRVKQHKGVVDPEQAWILGELIRYLEHPASGALAFDDMGVHWVSVRDGARSASLNRKSDGLEEVASRWDQLLQYIALRLSSEIGSDVTPVVAKNLRDPKLRMAYLTDLLCREGRLDGALKIPNTAGDLEVLADLRGQTVQVAVDLLAPQDKGAKGRVSWLVNQLKEPPAGLIVEAYPRNARVPNSAPFEVLVEDRMAVVGTDKKEPYRFRLLLRLNLGAARKSGVKQSSFIDSVAGAVSLFYGSVMQHVTPWQPSAPRLARPVEASDVDEDGGVVAPAWPNLPTRWESTPAESEETASPSQPIA